jgi:hypothetical protein
VKRQRAAAFFCLEGNAQPEDRRELPFERDGICVPWALLRRGVSVRRCTSRSVARTLSPRRTTTSAGAPGYAGDRVQCSARRCKHSSNRQRTPDRARTRNPRSGCRRPARVELRASQAGVRRSCTLPNANRCKCKRRSFTRAPTCPVVRRRSFASGLSARAALRAKLSICKSASSSTTDQSHIYPALPHPLQATALVDHSAEEHSHRFLA